MSFGWIGRRSHYQGSEVSYLEGGQGWGREVLYSEIQSIMSNGHMGPLTPCGQND